MVKAPCQQCDSPGGEKTLRNQVCMPLNGRVQCIDFCIHHIVAALNAGGISTVASCCGHGKMKGNIILEGWPCPACSAEARINGGLEGSCRALASVTRERAVVASVHLRIAFSGFSNRRGAGGKIAEIGSVLSFWQPSASCCVHLVISVRLCILVH